MQSSIAPRDYLLFPSCMGRCLLPVNIAQFREGKKYSHCGIFESHIAVCIMFQLCICATEWAAPTRCPPFQYSHPMQCVPEPGGVSESDSELNQMLFT